MLPFKDRNSLYSKADFMMRESKTLIEEFSGRIAFIEMEMKENT